jgi:hypothetical protein
MKLRLIAAILGLMLATAVAAGKQDITVVNKTGKPIHHVYISEEKTDDWEEDILPFNTHSKTRPPVAAASGRLGGARDPSRARRRTHRTRAGHACGGPPAPPGR